MLRHKKLSWLQKKAPAKYQFRVLYSILQIDFTLHYSFNELQIL